MKHKVLIDFSRPKKDEGWEIVNDEVMGGISQSKMIITLNKTAVFQGRVSLENYGGFASIRTYPQDFGLGDYAGLLVRVKGDGKQYRLRLRTDDHYNGIAYQASFTTQADQWISVHLPFTDFVPIFRGRVVPEAPVLKPERIRRIGFMIADKQEGSFCLEIEWIKAYIKR